MDQRSALAYQASTAENTLPKVLSKVKRLCSSFSWAFSASIFDKKKGLPFSILDESIGVSVMAVVVETHTTMVTIQPRSLNIMPAIPGSMVSGTNTATSTNVVAITEVHTSLVA